jgi:hypothetical protein
MSALLDQIRSTKADRIPKKFKTSAEWAAEWELSIPQAFRYLRDGVAQGVMIRQVFRVQTMSNRLFPVPHYAPAKRFKRAA